MPFPSGTFKSIATIEVPPRDGKFTYCRSHIFNSLTTDDTFWRCLTLTACYQLVQAVLKIGFVLAKRWDRGRWLGFNTGWLPWMAVEQLWLAQAHRDYLFCAVHSVM